MTDHLGTCRRVLAECPPGACYDLVVLGYAERHLRKTTLTTVHHETLDVDLPEPVRLYGGEALELEDGRMIEVMDGEDALYEVRGPELARYAWHLCAARIPCEIYDELLLIPRDAAAADLMRRLGADIAEASLPFHPEESRKPHGVVHHHASHTVDEGDEAEAPG